MTQLRQPRLQVLADGMILPGVLATEVTSNNYYAADRFSVRLAISADPQGLASWDARTASSIELQIGLGASGWTSLITGNIDSLSADPIAGTVQIEGRDLSSGLIEARTQEAFANQTASDVATILAGRHGLTAQATATTTPVGRYYSADHNRVTLDRFTRASTEWDLLVWLAQQENFDVFVTGTSLYFQPAQTDPTPVMVLQASSGGAVPPNISSLRVQRAMTLAGDIEVTVKSWNSQQQSAFTQTARRSLSSSDGSGLTRSYIYVRPNLTTDGALQMAQNKLATLASHEFVMTATMPGELVLSPRATVTLVGTGSAFDQNYVIDEIVRHFDAQQGFEQTLRAHTSSQDNG
jgi:phage protein D